MIPRSYSWKDVVLNPLDYQNALLCQSSSSLTGVINAFAFALSRISMESKTRAKCGTVWINQHPICRLLADRVRILSASGAFSDRARYAEALRYCEARAKWNPDSNCPKQSTTSHSVD